MNVDEHLLSLARGDAALARTLRDSLSLLANGPDVIWREIAREVLAGRTDLHQVMRSSAYHDTIHNVIAAFTGFRQTLTPQDIERLAQLAEADHHPEPDNDPTDAS